MNVAWTTRNAVFEESKSKPISKTGTLKISGNHLERKSSVKMTTLPSRRTRSSPPPPTPTLLPSRRSSRLRSQSVTVYKFKEDECQSFTNNKQQRSQSLRLQIPDNSVLSGKFLIWTLNRYLFKFPFKPFKADPNIDAINVEESFRRSVSLSISSSHR